MGSSDTDTDVPSHALLVGGSGDTGRRLADALNELGVSVVVTTRQSPDELDAEQFESADVRQWSGAGDDAGLQSLFEDLGPSLEGPLLVYNLVGAWLEHPEEAIWGVVQTLVEGCRAREIDVRLVHCSATSVYGDRPGDVLDESSRRSPELEVGRIHARTEDLLLTSELEGVAPFVLRLPHIYGPGRERTIDWMVEGEFAVAGDGTNAMHHIYIEDLVDALVAAATAVRPDPPLLNVVDDEAAPYGDYCDFITEACGHPPLERVSLERAKETGIFAEWLGPHMARDEILDEFYAYMTSSVDIDNERMKQVLDLDLSYPSYREGLHEILVRRDDTPLEHVGSVP